MNRIVGRERKRSDSYYHARLAELVPSPKMHSAREVAKNRTRRSGARCSYIHTFLQRQLRLPGVHTETNARQTVRRRTQIGTEDVELSHLNRSSLVSDAEEQQIGRLWH